MAIERVGIIGSGIMGSGVAEVAAKAGCEVVLRSRSQDTADAMLAGLQKSLARQVEKGRLEESERDAVLARVTATTELKDLADCDLVLESVVEDLGVKKELLAELDAIVKEGAILASNTSTLSVSELARQTGRPDRVCGIHFFNPAPVMKLVEVVEAEATSAETLAEATAFATRCGKNPVAVKDRSGFIVNALLFPYLNNAVRMLEDGIADREGIDAAMKDGCGFPMGPFELLDLVGLDTSLSILEALHEGLGDPNYEPRPTLRRLVEEGKLGRKTGEGFLTYG
jgi:3-hydroxybutyryl-CoA dehydrogenase